MRGTLAAGIKISVFALVTVLLTGVLAATIANTSLGSTTAYQALFTDVTGLNPGDDVRIAGVRMGQVSRIEVTDRKYARITFELAADRKLPAATTATVKYRNLVGQRYIALGTDVGDANAVLAPGSVIPLERTQPALNLTALFNGFKPLFQALSPQQVNQLAGELIQVLQGEGGTITSLLTHTASLTGAIADRDQVIGKVIDNLTTVLATVNARTPELAGLITDMQQLVTGLAADRAPIGSAISALDGLASATAGLLADARRPVQQDIAGLASVSELLNKSDPSLDAFLHKLPGNLQAFTRTASYGSWFNYYLCRMSGTVKIGELGLSVPIVPFPDPQMPARCGP
ncbi:MlaD family protein [Kutzneria viridogrisea]|uniref:Phospholipid/cholesterol/gamma-HCH transport system substrate-binding protein n=1 Tax=Kutzneria viridogrisea TaxID=47990 RepID=A0ABR6BM64_9PSEU|nr:phospholipid/cholesterol/gamma-HCH transport system substrate-binding protein [Kutzneria viridogrisea]